MAILQPDFKAHARVTRERGSVVALYDGTLFTNVDGTPRLSWWVQPKLWKQRYHASVILRETEDEALDALFYQARALARWRWYAPALDGVQVRLVHLETRVMKDRPHLSDDGKLQWIADMMSVPWDKWTPLRVKTALVDVTTLLGDFERARVDQLVTYILERKVRDAMKAEKTFKGMHPLEFKQLVRSVLTDEKRAA